MKIHNKPHIAAIAERLAMDAAEVTYGSVSATLRLHKGRIVDVTHSVTFITKGAKNEPAA